MSHSPGLVLPAFFSYYRSPIKVMPTPDGGLMAWCLSIDTGGWEVATHLVDEILFTIGGEISVLDGGPVRPADRA